MLTMLALFARIGHRQRGQQLLRVRILRILHDLVGIAVFHDLALVHHHDAVGKHVDHSKIMGDEQACETDFRLQSLEQLEHLRLHGHIQCGGRLIGDKQARLQRQSTRQGGTLALTTGQLMRIAVHVGTWKLHHFQQITHVVAGFISR